MATQPPCLSLEPEVDPSRLAVANEESPQGQGAGQTARRAGLRIDRTGEGKQESVARRSGRRLRRRPSHLAAKKRLGGEQPGQAEPSPAGQKLSPRLRDEYSLAQGPHGRGTCTA